jgi:hypothetical protein
MVIGGYDMLVIGIILGGAGGTLYFVYPAFVLSENMYLLTVIFVILLVGIMISIILLLLNVEHLIQSIVLNIFLFMENEFVKKITFKNLSIHRV